VGVCAVAWAVEAVIGYRGVTLGASVVAVVLVLELGMIVLFDVTALTHPAQTDVGAWLQPWRSDLLAVDGVGGVLAFGVAAFLGFETTAAFGEEVRSERSVGRATWTCLAFLGPSLADPSGIAPVLLPLLVVVAALAETRILLFEPARDHLPEPPDIPSDRPADPDRVDPLRPDPVRHAVVDRLAVAGRRHSRYRAERSARAGRPGPHAIVFLFRESEPDAQDRVTVATRMFVDGPDVADLPAVLAALHGRLRRTENPWIPT